MQFLHYIVWYYSSNGPCGAWWRNGESTWLGIQGSLDRVSPPSLRVVLEKDVNHIFSVGPGELGTLQWVWFEERYLPHSAVWQHVKLSKSPMEKVQKIQWRGPRVVWSWFKKEFWSNFTLGIALGKGIKIHICHEPRLKRGSCCSYVWRNTHT